MQVNTAYLAVFAVMVAVVLGGGSHREDTVVPEVTPLDEALVAEPVTVDGITVNETIKVPYPTPREEEGLAPVTPVEASYKSEAEEKSESPKAPPPTPRPVYGDIRDQEITPTGHLKSGPGHRRRTGDGFAHPKGLPAKALTNREVDKIEGKHDMLKTAWGHQPYKSESPPKEGVQAEEAADKKVKAEEKEEDKAAAEEAAEHKAEEAKKPYVSDAHVFTESERAEEPKQISDNKVVAEEEKKQITEDHNLLKEGLTKSAEEKAAEKADEADLPKDTPQAEADAAIDQVEAAHQAEHVPVSESAAPHDCGGCDGNTFCVAQTQRCEACPNTPDTCDSQYTTDEVSREKCQISCQKAPTGSAAGPPVIPSCTGYVKVFQHGDFTGWEAKFPRGDYNHAIFTEMGAKNDDQSSLKVPAGCVAKLYQHGEFTGWEATFPAGDYDKAAMKAKGAKNNDASSIVVQNAQ